MTDQAAWFARAGALVLAIVAGVTLFGAAPEHHGPGSAEARARNICMVNATLAEYTALNASGPAEARRVRAEREASCPPGPRETWEPAGLQRGLIFAAGAIALLLASRALGSMARREALAKEHLRELRRHRDHR